MDRSGNHSFAYISSWANFGGTGGLGLYRFDGDCGKLGFVRMVEDDLSSGMTIVDMDRNVLYLLNEQADIPEAELGAGGGRLFVYGIDPVSGDLAERQRLPSYGANPCALTLDSTGKFLIVAHHASHAAVTKVDKDINGAFRIHVLHDDITLCLFPVGDDGTVGDPVDVVKHTGWIQGKRIPHASLHSATMAPSGEFFSVVDIGEARIYMYKIDYINRKLALSAVPFEDEPGSLPRYCLFHPELPYFYVNHEMGSLDVVCCTYDRRGNLTETSRVSSMPAGYVKRERDEQQDFRMHPSGKYIYDAVNGPDVIAVFEVDEQTGLLTLIQNQELSGKWARCCALSPDGRFLVATCLKGDKVEVFSIGSDGRLSPTGHFATQNNASWVTFYNPHT